MALQLITPPAEEPVTLTQAKTHLRVNHDDEDDMIRQYLRMATQYADGKNGFLGRAIVTQTWELTIDRFPTHEIKLPLPPLQSVTSIKYIDADGNEQTVNPAIYYVDIDSEPGWVIPNNGEVWPTTMTTVNAVRVRYVAGYKPTTDSPPDLTGNIPADIKAAILLYCGALYGQREQIIVGSNVAQLPWGAEQLLRRHKFNLSMA